MKDGITGRVFNIQRYSIHDGAGIRTLVFLKGCPLRCLWCSNPESQKSTPELGFIQSRCVGSEGCDAPCVSVCPVEAIRLDGQTKPLIDRDVCNTCGKCAEVCHHDALKVVGREMSVDEVMAEVEKDRPFYRRSGGGLTVGGGEPLAQYQFAAGLLEAAHESYLHTALETCGHAPWPHFAVVLEHVDLLQFDIKHMDPVRHKEMTGQSNELILDNLKKVRSIKDPHDVIIRIPVVPGCNNSAENIRSTADFAAGLGFRQIELVPYHRLGTSKYAQYGMVNPLARCEPPSEADMAHLREVVRASGVTEVGGSI
jgi:pyruvate formate lyase activating enzyme